MRRALLRACSLVAIFLLIGLPAVAGPLAAAKAAGQVGEKPDGYIGLVDEAASAEIRELVEGINSRRRAKYQEVADQSGTALPAVAARAGTKLIERTAEGEFVMDESGKWMRK